jgi:hypothetical protein
VDRPPLSLPCTSILMVDGRRPPSRVSAQTHIENRRRLRVIVVRTLPPTFRAPALPPNCVSLLTPLREPFGGGKDARDGLITHTHAVDSQWTPAPPRSRTLLLAPSGLLEDLLFFSHNLSVSHCKPFSARPPPPAFSTNLNKVRCSRNAQRPAVFFVSCFTRVIPPPQPLPTRPSLCLCRSQETFELPVRITGGGSRS